MGQAMMKFQIRSASRISISAMLTACGLCAFATAGPLDDLRPLVTTRSWTEQEPDGGGGSRVREITAEI